MAALARLYAAREGSKAGRPAGAGRPDRGHLLDGARTSILIKGPIGPMVVGLALLALWGWTADRLGEAAAVVVGAGGLPVPVRVPGRWPSPWPPTAAFWTEAIGGDLAPKLNSGDEGHPGFPGYHLSAAPSCCFPGDAARARPPCHAWRRRSEPACASRWPGRCPP
jgi:hypothetical protein